MIENECLVFAGEIGALDASSEAPGGAAATDPAAMPAMGRPTAIHPATVADHIPGLDIDLELGRPLPRDIGHFLLISGACGDKRLTRRTIEPAVGDHPSFHHILHVPVLNHLPCLRTQPATLHPQGQFRKQRFNPLSH